MPEQQLGHAYNVDCDLDNFAAAVGFARQAVLGLAADEGKPTSTFHPVPCPARYTAAVQADCGAEIEIEVGESSLEESVYEPVQNLLDLVKSVKGPAR